MTSSTELDHRLRYGGIRVDGEWTDAFVIPGGIRGCHPDHYIGTPIDPNRPYGFLVCQRKKEPEIDKISPVSGRSQSHNLYDSTPGAHPIIKNQYHKLFDRRPPNQAHLQGLDYFKEPIRYKGIGIEKLETFPGEFGHRENKYLNSSPPPRYDITHAVQPFDLWKREQLRNKHFTMEEMEMLEKNHTFSVKSSTF